MHFYYVVGVNWFFRMAFKVLSVFMSKKTTEKIRILAGVSEFKQYIDEQQLLIDYGGKFVIPGRFIPLEGEVDLVETENFKKEIKQ